MPWTYRPALDGLRSVAVYLVLLFHAGLSAFDGGFIGVDLFFVLSGFVVSNVILSEIDRTGRLDVGGFYARRVRRLLPAAVTVIVATSVVFLIIAPVVRRLPLVRDAQSALLYVANWNFLLKQDDYFAADVDRSPFLHFWSLAIEEQFYVVFPLLLLLLVGLSRRRGWVLPAGLGALFALSLGSQVVWGLTDTSRAYYGTDARLYQLLAGVLLAIALRRPGRLTGPRTAGWVSLGALAALLALGSGLLDLSPSVRGIAATLPAALLIGGLVLGEDGPLGRLLSRRAPVFLGKVSYGTYLWHWPVILVLEEFLHVRPVVVAVLAALLSTALAALSFELLELPVRTARPLQRFRWSAAVSAVASSALVAVAVVPIVLASDRTPRLASGTALPGVAEPTSQAPVVPRDAVVRDAPRERDVNAKVPRDMDWDKVLHDFGPNVTCTADDTDECVVVRGDGPHVLLVGDSHARMLGPMFVKLAKEHDLTLSMNVVPSCPWQEGVRNLQPPEKHQDKCISRRGKWYDKAMPKLDPDVVVLATLGRDGKEWKTDLVREDGSEADLSELTFSTTTETLRKITSQGRRALVVKNILTADFDPIECLSGARRVARCQVPMNEPPVSNAYYRIAADRIDDVYTVDLNPIICGRGPYCLPMQDGIVVFRNFEHLTTKITTHYRADIWRAIRRSGALDDL